jgi:hypothetical protein
VVEVNSEAVVVNARQSNSCHSINAVEVVDRRLLSEARMIQAGAEVEETEGVDGVAELTVVVDLAADAVGPWKSKSISPLYRSLNYCNETDRRPGLLQVYRSLIHKRHVLRMRPRMP